MVDVLGTITRYQQERGWTEYRLSEKSGISQSTISTWYRKRMNPTIASLEKICDGFGITLSQFFADGHEAVELTESQAKLIQEWAKLDAEQQAAVFQLIAVMQKPIE